MMKLFVLALLACSSGLKSSAMTTETPDYSVSVTKSEIDELIIDYINHKKATRNAFKVGSWSSMSFNEGDVNINYDMKNIYTNAFDLNSNELTIKMSTLLNDNDFSGFIQIFQTFTISGEVTYKGKIKEKPVNGYNNFEIRWGEVRQDISFNTVHGPSSPMNVIDLQINTTLSDPVIKLWKDDDTLNKFLINTFEKFAHSFDEQYRKAMPLKKEWLNKPYNQQSLQKWYDQMRKIVPRRMFAPLVLF